MPDLVTEVVQGDRRWAVEGGAAFHPQWVGPYYLLAGRDTVGGLSVNLDPRESMLAPASDDQVMALWHGARVVSLAEAQGAAFAGTGRTSLQAPLLWLALLLGLVEVGLASGRVARQMTLALLLDAFEHTAFAFDLRDRLPVRGMQLPLAGLPGSSPAVLVAWLARTYPERCFAVVATTPADAERWLTDLQHLTDLPIALYPQRESLGEDEPHYEIAGERAETLSALLEGRLRILVTTARATEERTRVAAGLREGTLRIRPHAPPVRGAGRTAAGATLSALADALEAMGYERVATVTEVAQFSVRGGIIDVYGFGMANPARLEWWGDDLETIRVFDLTSQRSGDPLEEITVLPLGGSAARRREPTAAPMVRQSLLELLPSDTLIVEDSGSANAEEVSRAWREAEHHLEVARRLGEEVSAREDLFEPPESWVRRMATFPRLSMRDPAPALNAGFFPPEAVERDIRRLRGMLAGEIPSLILCDNEGQLERLDELLNDGGSRVNATLAIGALDGGFVMRSLRVLTDHEIFRRARRLRRARRYRQAAPSAATGTARRPATTWSTWSTASASTAGSRLSRWGSRRSRSRSSSTRGATGSTCRCTGWISWSGTARRAMTATSLRPGSTNSAAPAGSGCGTRPARRSRRWRRSCSISTPVAR